MNDRPSLVFGPDEPLPGRGGGPGGRGAGPHRHASVQLRGAGAEGGGGDAALMDPANQSLADALRVTLTIIKLAMIVLAVLFAVSGFQTIHQGEKGIRLLFGKKVASDLPAGLGVSFPYPLGELVKVRESTDPIELYDAFMPRASDADRDKAIDQRAKMASVSLNPEFDGSLLTADGNIAHARLRIVYKRAKPEEFAENIDTDVDESGVTTEVRIIQAAVQRGVVQAAARTNIDDLLHQSSTDESSLAVRAKQIAQQMLDRMSSGLRIDQIILVQAMAPLRLYEDFTRVQTAQSKAKEATDKAQADASRMLNGAAGAAAAYLVPQIDRFEQALDRKDEAGQAAALATIGALLEGREVEIDGTKVSGAISGEVGQIMSDALQYRNTFASRAKAELDLFNAKRDQFRSNPLVVVHRDWADSLRMFLDHDTVQVVMMPPNAGPIQVEINSDPDVQKGLREARRQAEVEQNAKRRLQDMRDSRFKTDTNGPVDSR